MGIHGLSYFIRSFPTLVENQKWEIKKDNVTTDHFIIDGNAFVYHLAHEHRTHWTHGGQYATIAQAVRSTVSTLQEAGIQLCFMFDGALPQDKIDTRLKRHKSYIERCATTIHNLKQINTNNKDQHHEEGIQYFGDIFLIPPLTLEIVIQTLKELKVDVKICHAEADSEVVKMAKEKMAYVISQDSDMHVYPNVGKGYISFEQLKVPHVTTDEVQYVSAGVCRPETLAQLLNIRPYQLPLLGTLLGNDYLDADVIRFPISQWCTQEGIQIAKSNHNGWPKIVAELIKKCSNQGDTNTISQVATQLKPIIANSSIRSKDTLLEELEERIVNSIMRYDTESPLVGSEKPEYTSDDDIAVDAICKESKYYHSGYSRHIMDVIKSKTCWTGIFLEDIERECSWDVSRSLRQNLYGTIIESMGQNKDTKEEKIVNEYIREKQHLGVIQIECDKPIQKSQSSFYHQHATLDVDKLSSISSVLHPTILCTRYMIYHCSRSISQGKLFNYEVIGMIIASLRSLAPILGLKQVPLAARIVIPPLKKRSIHLGAQYQHIVYSSFLLSQMVDIEYLQSPQVLAHIYHGIYFHHYIELARLGTSLGKMLHGTSLEFKVLFCSVYHAITYQLEDDIENVFDYGLIDASTISDHKPKRFSSKKESQKPEKKKKKLSSKNTGNNRSTNAFNVLSFGCQFDE